MRIPPNVDGIRMQSSAPRANRENDDARHCSTTRRPRLYASRFIAAPEGKILEFYFSLRFLVRREKAYSLSSKMEFALGAFC